MTDFTVDPAVAALLTGCSALLFGSAAAHKLRNFQRFAEIFGAYGLLPPVRLAVAVPLVEIFVAAGLLFPVSRPIAALTGTLLLLVYAGAISINLQRGRRDLACGCGGPYDRRPIAPWMVWRNIAIALVMLVLLWPLGERSLEATDAVTIGFGTATTALVYLCLDGMLGAVS